MASSSSVGSRNLRRNVRPILRSRCDCGDAVGKWTSWTRKNPGRRFIECPNFQDEDKDCEFFVWVDPPLPNQWYKDLVFEQHVNGNVGHGGIFAEFVDQEPEVEVVVGPPVPVHTRHGIIQGSWMFVLVIVLFAVVWFVCK